MSINTTTPKKRVQRGKRPSTRKYVSNLAENPEMTKDEAKLDAGFSPATSPGSIERTHKFQVAVKSVQEQREAIQVKPGYRLADLSKVLKNIYKDNVYEKGSGVGVRTRKEVKPKDMISAIKEQKEILGYKAPDELHTQHRALLLAFNGLDGGDLTQLLQHCDDIR